MAVTTRQTQRALLVRGSGPEVASRRRRSWQCEVSAALQLQTARRGRCAMRRAAELSTQRPARSQSCHARTSILKHFAPCSCARTCGGVCCMQTPDRPSAVRVSVLLMCLYFLLSHPVLPRPHVQLHHTLRSLGA
ncbi:uncharacterized protein M421DRAFT_312826 [Didymella exigua CBS 183.55]|uniref:Uncharacterized protein n=1 Tax=Didymella exigua CBS 183.55 TaxID=1150837 RepID=A0A6A5RV73_9PLEO|nr:uncharacterized protein M421DRAFT_312826 [Didymella exigua CBS 183.55]KAF1931479.1 hypothetical protein M421DRAFT_312826 [Didymella exigua CBS 183.55]